MDRAFPWPPAAGISAARQSRVRVSYGLIGGLVMMFTNSSPKAAGSAGSTAGGGTRSATRGSCSGAKPMWKSAPSGPAISSRNTAPRDFPVIRRTTSPTR